MKTIRSILIIIFVLSNLLWLIETKKDPFGEARYLFEMDSVSLCDRCYNLVAENYLSYSEKERSDLRWNLDYKNNAFQTFFDNDKKQLSGTFYVHDNGNETSTLYLSEVSYHNVEKGLVSKFFSDGYTAHDYFACRLFETEVLDKLEIKYQKDCKSWIKNWYARWFFNNQIYFILIIITVRLIMKIYKRLSGYS